MQMYCSVASNAIRSTLVALALALALPCATPSMASAQSDVPQRRAVTVRRDPTTAAIPSWSEQISIREGWLVKRHRMLLDMMRKHDVQMWVVVNEEFHNDPLTEFIAPPRPYTGNRDFFIFVDTGGSELKKVAVTGYSEDNLRRFFESPDEPKPISVVLPDLFKRDEYPDVILQLCVAQRMDAVLKPMRKLFSRPKKWPTLGLPNSVRAELTCAT